MKRIARFARKWWEGMRMLWGCQANPILKIVALPVMAGIAFLCCLLDLIDGEAK